jgi:nucleosome binding factor SPN SPT16 subunit
MADIKIDGKLFQERINHFITSWKSDKRAGDQVFNGVSSIVVMMGKVEENPEFHKNNAMHVSHSPFRPYRTGPAFGPRDLLLLMTF